MRPNWAVMTTGTDQVTRVIRVTWVTWSVVAIATVGVPGILAIQILVAGRATIGGGVRSRSFCDIMRVAVKINNSTNLNSFHGHSIIVQSADQHILIVPILEPAMPSRSRRATPQPRVRYLVLCKFKASNSNSTAYFECQSLPEVHQFMIKLSMQVHFKVTGQQVRQISLKDCLAMLRLVPFLKVYEHEVNKDMKFLVEAKGYSRGFRKWARDQLTFGLDGKDSRGKSKKSKKGTKSEAKVKREDSRRRGKTARTTRSKPRYVLKQQEQTQSLRKTRRSASAVKKQQ